jgi:pimeloyl-ACP methyl ester carboxylesterase
MIAEALFDTGEIKLNYAEGGSIGKPAMVLVHGLTGRWQAYTEDFEVYGKDWHIYALDLRGHGKSSKPSEGYLLPDYVRDVECFLRQKVAEPVVLVGHSLGGLVTLATAFRAPEMVRALTANDPPLLGVDLRIDDYPWAKLWFSWVYETMKPNPSFEQVLAVCKAANPNAGEADLQAMAERVYEVAPGTVKIALEDRQKENFDLPAALQQIICPALLLYGDFESGSAVRDRDAHEFQELVPQSVVCKIPGGNHGFWWEQADITRVYVQEFLSKV